MQATIKDEWGVIETLLPAGWRQAAREQKAFQRARYTRDLPHKNQRAAKAWILAKLVVALVLETLYRNARTFSPWGYRIAGRAPVVA